ncbi:hypothetical protein AMATHDRAFT_70161 [Amanita thiersii Skay4041]|uniref:Uncharacterized protein n=1 Tax=Amanita thiersii Skay4041 TaxID=703135 RepID=A0A2A9N8U6_9AGAR|nr:hypothetical protein AMATHDRAFT_70161 [Amanita thiersii Skay4041]
MEAFLFYAGRLSTAMCQHSSCIPSGHGSPRSRCVILHKRVCEDPSKRSLRKNRSRGHVPTILLSVKFNQSSM